MELDAHPRPPEVSSNPGLSNACQGTTKSKMVPDVSSVWQDEASQQNNIPLNLVMRQEDTRADPDQCDEDAKPVTPVKAEPDSDDLAFEPAGICEAFLKLEKLHNDKSKKKKKKPFNAKTNPVSFRDKLHQEHLQMPLTANIGDIKLNVPINFGGEPFLIPPNLNNNPKADTSPLVIVPAIGSSSGERIKLRKGNKQFVCKTCGKIFRYLSIFTRHCQTHTGEKPHECAECGKRFTQLGHLKIHMLTHTGEKPHVCVVCNKAFNQWSHLHKHLLTHTGEKPHVCSYCGKGFIQTSNLKSHMLTHTGEKAFVCIVCNKAFARLDALKVHQTTHK